MIRQSGRLQVQGFERPWRKFRRAKRATPAGFLRGRGADVDRGARSRENRHIRIHGAELGARSAIQSGSDHDRSTSNLNKGIR